MARRRRAFSSRSCLFAFFLIDFACFKERTSFVISKFAQSRRRWFTDSNFGVSLLASDAEPSDHKANEESLVLVVSDPRSFQIWRARSSLTATFLYLVDRDPFSEHSRRPSSFPSFFSGPHIPVPQEQPFSAASTLWLGCRHVLLAHAAARNLGFQVWGQIWVLLIMGRILDRDLMGLLAQKPWLFSPQSTLSSALKLCRCRLRSPYVCFSSIFSHQLDFQSAISFDWWYGPMSVFFHPRLKTYRSMETAKFPSFHWRCSAEALYHLGSSEVPRYQISSCRGQERKFLSSSFSKERTISPSLPSLLVWVLYRLLCAVRSTLVCEGCYSEALISDIFKGSSIWCVVAFDSVAEFWIVFSAISAESIANNGSFLMLVVYHGASSLLAFNVVKARRHRDDVFCLRIEFACTYHLIYCFYVSCLGFVAALLLNLMNLSVTILSFDGE